MSGQMRDYVGTGAAFILGDSKLLMPQMNSSGKCKVYAGLKADHSYMDDHPLPEVGKRREWIKALYAGWGKEVEDLIDACEEETVVPRRIYAYDPDHGWTTDLKGVTIMGEPSYST